MKCHKVIPDRDFGVMKDIGQMYQGQVFRRLIHGWGLPEAPVFIVGQDNHVRAYSFDWTGTANVTT